MASEAKPGSAPTKRPRARVSPGAASEAQGMADEAQLSILRQGVEVWNAWRQEHPESEPKLRDAKLRGFDLHKANLCKADLRRTDLRGANLYDAKLRGAKLLGANLGEAKLGEVDLRWADLRGA